MTAIDIITKKRDRGELAADEISRIVEGFVRGEVADAQMAALLMAILLNGMTGRECADLTLAMANSGERIDLSEIPGVKVDKHSTGGVGDKTTLIVAPLVAALGVPVTKMSGRSLGHTGGTIDKLEVIRGLRTDLTPARFVSQVSKIGVAIAAQSASMVPADKKMYALRDTTATVESVPLIASSVMSKKLASGADAIVLDVKAGTGAFMPDVERAGELARMMVEIGAHNGKQVVALVTRMDQPLGAAVGDAVELAEAVAVLSGGGPADVAELCGVLAAHMLVLGGVSRNLDDGIARAQEGLRTRIGLAKLRQMVIAQGGDPSAIDNPELLSRGLERISIAPDRHGFVAGLDARQIGLAIHDLKAAVGDRKPYCGALLHRKVGDAADGELAVLLHPAGARSAAISAANRIRAAYYVSDTAPPAAPLVAETISSRSL